MIYILPTKRSKGKQNETEWKNVETIWNH
jgi:hypothetical protein